MKKISKRFTEASTWTALGAIGALFGAPQLAVFGVPEVATQFASLAALVLGVVLPEKGNGE